MTDREALKLALEALRNSQDYKQGRASTIEAVEDIEEALAQPVQEPVCDKDPQGCWNVRCQLGKKCKNTASPAAQPVQEPVAWYHNDFGSVELSRIPRAGWKPLYTTPPLPVQPEKRNFCPRCGKRRGGDVNYIHTCTPPQENT